MHNKLMLLTCLLMGFLPMKAVVNDHLIDRLDSILKLQSLQIEGKEREIKTLKTRLNHERNGLQKLQLCDQLYEAYHVFQFDSAMTYVEKGLQLANNLHNKTYYADNLIHKAELLAIGGLYNEALQTIELVNTTDLSRRQFFNYYLTHFRIYSYWSDFCNDAIYAPRYRQYARTNLSLAMPFLDKTDRTYEYYQGEYCGYILNNPIEAQQHYLKAIAMTPENSRVHAMACFALACTYSAPNEISLYERYIVMACISDARSLTMENLALQVLAMYILEHGHGNLDIAAAQRYINISLENAKFYNNRLRILEISDRLPAIVDSYQAQLSERNTNLRNTLFAISLLAVFLIAAVGFIFKQNSRLTQSRQKLQESNNRLSEMNKRQGSLNEQLHDLNEQLVKTNKKREGLVRLYIDLCSRYINRLKKQQTLVKRKIKANQAQELLSLLSSERLSEEDAATFLSRFDRAFLDLYPTFPQELNALLLPDCQIIQPSSHAMTTEQRIMALVRLGVNESAEIANLLFYSPQTIYNYRSAIKAKAILKEPFESEVAKLCTVIG